MGGQCHETAALPPGKRDPVPIIQTTGSEISRPHPTVVRTPDFLLCLASRLKMSGNIPPLLHIYLGRVQEQLYLLMSFNVEWEVINSEYSGETGCLVIDGGSRVILMKKK